jgi:tetratricopeptide (TPR) repeat protein
MRLSPRIFISYSHDSRSHCDRVLELAQQLRCDGIAAELDQFHQGELLHWPRWCEERIRPENADFILCICTAEYARRIEGRTAADVGKGVFWEGTLIYNELYYDAKGNPRCVPVLLNGTDDADIPRVLKNYTRFRLDSFGLDDIESGYAKLYRLLTQQTFVSGAELGGIIHLPPLPEAERSTDFGTLIENIRAGLIEIGQDTKAIRREQEAHSILLQRIYKQAAQHRWSALHQLKPPPEHFTGRAEPLAELCGTLREQAQAGNAVVISSVNGMGGVGKTALAIMAAHAMLPDFPDMQLFLELRAHSPQPVSAEQARDSVLQAIHPESRLPDDDDARWQIYRNLFHRKDSGANLRALVILDDAADDEQVRLLSPSLGCALLVTSRRRLRTGHPLHLDRLPRTEAIALLLAHAPRLTELEAERLARLCGDLAVALKTAGGYLKAYRSKPVAEYLAELERGRLRRLSNLDQPAEDVNLVFEASYRALSEAERRAWAALSVMPADFDRDAAKALMAVADPEQASATSDLLDRLVHLNLLDYAESSERYSWHDLLRDYAVARLPEEEAEQARDGHAKYFAEVAWQTRELYQSGNDGVLKGLALFDREHSHIEAAFRFMSGQVRHARLLIRLVEGVAYTGYLRFHPRKRISWLEAQRETAQLIQDWQAESRALGNLGIAYRNLGQQLKAIEYHEKHLALAREIGDQRGEGIALGNLGVIYDDLGESLKAIDYQEQYLAITKQIGNKEGESIALGNLGEVYCKLGEPHRAIEYYIQALNIAWNTGDQYGKGYLLGVLGIAYRQLGNPLKAIHYHDQQLTITREIGDQRGEGNALWNLALAYEDLSERAEALNRAERALAIYEAIEDPNTTQVRAQLAEWRGNDGGTEAGG